jgi:hypothetical protein
MNLEVEIKKIKQKKQEELRKEVEIKEIKRKKQEKLKKEQQIKIKKQNEWKKPMILNTIVFDSEIVFKELLKMDCYHLFGIARSLRIEDHRSMTRRDLALVMIERIGSDTWRDKEIRNPTKTCKEAGILYHEKGFLTNKTKQEQNMSGLMCSLKKSAQSFKKQKQDEYHLNTKKCKIIPIYNVNGQDCGKFMIKSLSGCCVKPKDMNIAIWDVTHMNTNCKEENCPDILETKEEKSEVKELSQLMKTLPNSEQLTLMLGTLTYVQKNMVDSFAETFNYYFKSSPKDCTFHSLSEFVRNNAKSQTPNILKRGLSWMDKKFGVEVFLSKMMIAIHKIMKWSWAGMTLIIGGTRWVLNTWGHKLAFFILAKPLLVKQCLKLTIAVKQVFCKKLGTFLYSTTYVADWEEKLKEEYIRDLAGIIPPLTPQQKEQAALYPGNYESYASLDKEQLKKLKQEIEDKEENAKSLQRAAEEKQLEGLTQKEKEAKRKSIAKEKKRIKSEKIKKIEDSVRADYERNKSINKQNEREKLTEETKEEENIRRRKEKEINDESWYTGAGIMDQYWNMTIQEKSTTDGIKVALITGLSHVVSWGTGGLIPPGTTQWVYETESMRQVLQSTFGTFLHSGIIVMGATFMPFILDHIMSVVSRKLNTTIEMGFHKHLYLSSLMENFNYMLDILDVWSCVAAAFPLLKYSHPNVYRRILNMKHTAVLTAHIAADTVLDMTGLTGISQAYWDNQHPDETDEQRTHRHDIEAQQKILRTQEWAGVDLMRMRTRNSKNTHIYPDALKSMLTRNKSSHAKLDKTKTKLYDKTLLLIKNLEDINKKSANTIQISYDEAEVLVANIIQLSRRPRSADKRKKLEAIRVKINMKLEKKLQISDNWSYDDENWSYVDEWTATIRGRQKRQAAAVNKSREQRTKAIKEQIDKIGKIHKETGIEFLTLKQQKILEANYAELDAIILQSEKGFIGFFKRLANTIVEDWKGFASFFLEGFNVKQRGADLVKLWSDGMRKTLRQCGMQSRMSKT